MRITRTAPVAGRNPSVWPESSGLVTQRGLATQAMHSWPCTALRCIPGRRTSARFLRQHTYSILAMPVAKIRPAIGAQPDRDAACPSCPSRPSRPSTPLEPGSAGLRNSVGSVVHARRCPDRRQAPRNNGPTTRPTTTTTTWPDLPPRRPMLFTGSSSCPCVPAYSILPEDQMFSPTLTPFLTGSPACHVSSYPLPVPSAMKFSQYTAFPGTTLNTTPFLASS